MQPKAHMPMPCVCGLQEDQVRCVLALAMRLTGITEPALLPEMLTKAQEIASQLERSATKHALSGKLIQCHACQYCTWLGVFMEPAHVSRRCVHALKHSAAGTCGLLLAGRRALASALEMARGSHWWEPCSTLHVLSCPALRAGAGPAAPRA